MRNILIAAFVTTVTLTSPALADKAEECRLQADIVERASTLRLDRTSEKKAVEIMSSGEDEAVAEKYVTAVPAIVDWVYNTLKRKDLKSDPGPAQSYYAACVAQE